MSAMLSGLTLAEARARIGRQIDAERAALDDAARALIEQGLAVWSEDGDRRPVLIVRGQARVIDDAAAADLARVRHLIDDVAGTQENARMHTSAPGGAATQSITGTNKLQKRRASE